MTEERCPLCGAATRYWPINTQRDIYCQGVDCGLKIRLWPLVRGLFEALEQRHREDQEYALPHEGDCADDCPVPECVTARALAALPKNRKEAE